MTGLFTAAPEPMSLWAMLGGGLLVLMVRFMPGGLFGSSSPIVRGSLWVFRKITGKGGAAA